MTKYEQLSIKSIPAEGYNDTPSAEKLTQLAYKDRLAITDALMTADFRHTLPEELTSFALLHLLPESFKQ